MRTTFVVTQVRQALQQAVAAGAFSAYFAAACATGLVQTLFNPIKRTPHSLTRCDVSALLAARRCRAVRIE